MIDQAASRRAIQAAWQQRARLECRAAQLRVVTAVLVPEFPVNVTVAPDNGSVGGRTVFPGPYDASGPTIVVFEGSGQPRTPVEVIAILLHELAHVLFEDLHRGTQRVAAETETHALAAALAIDAGDELLHVPVGEVLECLGGYAAIRRY